jgi:prepilin-type N-terminal cleavage/methylation domain-containing protein
MLSRKERRRRAQAGTTLIELLVSVMIIGLVLVLVIGSLSTGVLDATLAKRNAGVTAATEYEMEKISASSYSASPASYSECFAVDSAPQPFPIGYRASCPTSATYNLRADVTENDVPGQAGVQLWAIQIVTYPALTTFGPAISIYKVHR